MEIESAHEPRLWRASTGRTTARRFQRMARAGTLQRLVPGVYLRPDDWDGLDARSRHLVLIRALAPRLPRDAAISHLSAAAVRGWAHIGRWPDRVQVTQAGRARSEISRVTVRSSPPFDAERPGADTFAGVELVSAAATAVGAVLDATFSRAVVLLDDAYRKGLRPAEVEPLVEQHGPRGRVHLERVLRTSDLRHESVGESFCAARLAELGFVDVVAQQEFPRQDGSVDRVDFWLPSVGFVVEFDGRQKYTDPTMTGGRAPADVLWQEKIREDRIRPQVNGFIRVRWWHLVDPDRLRALFRQFGLVP